jgi:hypothetical protein
VRPDRIRRLTSLELDPSHEQMAAMPLLVLRRVAMRSLWQSLALGVIVVPCGVAAQAPAPGSEPHEHGVPEHATLTSGASTLTLSQIHEVGEAVRALATPGAARAAGFRPVLGLIPTMGTHWVSARRMATRDGFDRTRPEHLMFAPIDGVQTLVGAAFAYQGRPGEPTPDAFDGDLDRWHAHPELSPPGSELTMLHVWFVPSPDGPFAGHNPWLPYLAVGLDLPDPSRLSDPVDSYRIRALALALAETVEPFGVGRLLQALSAPLDGNDVEARREAIRALIPVLYAAGQGGDIEDWNRAADRAVSEWEAIRSTYLAAIPLPYARARIAEFYDEMVTGGHSAPGAHEHE